ncbi:two-component regulator propeller domain-containing protein [Algivirga pacifica]|uniref:Two-component regulator propeller domain-containing protein n=1 Tax=Algivirga pacifica TaxID=1162670 RepID=A0ABP9DBR1_9BACT
MTNRLHSVLGHYYQWILGFFILGIGLFIHPVMLQAQNIPVGSWRTHLSHYQAREVLAVEDRVYSASQNGLFYYVPETGELVKQGRLEGFSDTQVSALGYANTLERLLVTYRNGNMDVQESDGSLVNIRTILNSEFADKRIYDVLMEGTRAYISTAFGVVVLDMVEYKILETYNRLGREGEEIRVFEVALDEDFIYIGSSQGVKRASRSVLVNKQDFKNWEQLTNKVANQLLVANGQLYYWVAAAGVYQWSDNQEVIIQENTAITGIETDGVSLYILSPNQVEERENANVVATYTHRLMNQPLSITLDAQGILWVADATAGLLRLDDEMVQLFPSGPFSAETYRLFYFENKIVALRGGWNEGALNRPATFSIFEAGEWTNYTAEENNIGAVKIPSINDLTGFAYNSFNGKAYFSSYQGGLLEWNITENTFTILTSIFGEEAPSFHSVVTDGVGDIWMATDRRMYTLKLSGEVESFEVPVMRQPLDMRFHPFGQLWVRLANGGVVAYQQEQYNILTEGDGNGGLPNSNVLSLQVDREQSVWIGTSEGVAEFFNPLSAVTDMADDAVIPRVDGRPVLNEDRVHAIAIDGGNRKWFGTNTGVWVLNASASAQIEQFNMENSPLLSNTIVDMVIHPITGEVFISTDKGLISYRSASGVKELSEVSIFPNPLRPTDEERVTMTGVAEDAQVKITDTAGRLVWEGRAVGSTVTWNSRTLEGKEVSTGIYLIFSSTVDGEEYMVGKVGIIR